MTSGGGHTLLLRNQKGYSWHWLAALCVEPDLSGVGGCAGWGSVGAAAPAFRLDAAANPAAGRGTTPPRASLPRRRDAPGWHSRGPAARPSAGTSGWW